MEMREIKFRAWDNRTDKEIHNFPRKSQMTYRVDIHSGDEQSETGKDYWIAHHYDSKKDEVYSFSNERGILMQYTGLKDKEGKEIFEGDVIAVIVEQIEFIDEKGKTWFTTFHKDGKYAKIVNRKSKELHRVVIKWLEDSTTQSGGYNSEHHGGYNISFPYTTWYRIDQYEIIGNIYSNPELNNK